MEEDRLKLTRIKNVFKFAGCCLICWIVASILAPRINPLRQSEHVDVENYIKNYFPHIKHPCLKGKRN